LNIFALGVIPCIVQQSTRRVFVVDVVGLQNALRIEQFVHQRDE